MIRSASKNICSVRQRPIPSAPNSRAVRQSSGVSALARTPSRRFLSAQAIKVPKSPTSSGWTVGTAPSMTSPEAPSMVITAPSAMSWPPTRIRLRLVVDGEHPRARDAGPAHAAGDDGGVAGHAAARGQYALGRVHAVNVLGAGLDPDQDHLLAGRRPFLGGVGVEHRLAAGGAGRGGQALGDDLAVGLGIERGMEQLVERGGIDPEHRLLLADQAFADHVDGDAQRRLGGALAGAGLQHPERAALDRELDVLHVAIVALEQVEDPGQLGEHVGHRLFHRRRLGAGALARSQRQILRGADAGDDVLALGVDQIFAIISALAGGGIAGEGDAGRRGLAHIAEHHRLDVDRGAPVAGDMVDAAIGPGALRLPGAEHRADRAPELIVHVLREGPAPKLLDQLAVAPRQPLPVGRLELGVEMDALVLLGDLERLLERAVIEAQDDVGIHLDEAAIAVPGEARRRPRRRRGPARSRR